MATKKLTQGFVSTAKAEEGKDRTLYWDASLPGFGLMVMAKGHRSYVAQYRANGQSRRVTLANAAQVDLEAARKQARKLFGEVAGGQDPAAEKRKVERYTLKAVCENYLAREGDKLRSLQTRQATLTRLVYPVLGERPIEEVRRRDIAALLDKVQDERGTPMADLVLSLLRRIFNWYATRDDDFVSPIVRGMARSNASERERDRILSDDELRAVWKAAEQYPGAPWGQYIRLLLLTATRRGEVAGMTWDEVQGDIWTIPKSRYKTKPKEDVVFPLSKAALKVLAEVPHIQGSEYPFSTNGRTPVGGFSGLKLRFDLASGVRDWTLHDLRRTARSLLSRCPGVTPDISERCLGHKIGGQRGVYDRYPYIEEMRHAFEALASLIETIVHPVENVMPIRTAL
jgi:integrase